MSNKYTWYIPDTLTITDPTEQGPMVAPSEDGMTNVVVGTNWALKAVADDGTEVVLNGYTPFAPVDSKDFVPFDDVSVQHLESWLFNTPDGTGSLNKLDQQGQADDKIRAAQRSKQKMARKPLNPSAPPMPYADPAPAAAESTSDAPAPAASDTQAKS